MAAASTFYCVSFQPFPPLIRGLVLRPLTAAEFTESCEMLLAEARPHGCPYWLLDGRNDANVRPPDVYEWLTEEFLPRVRKVLGRVPRLAFVAEASFWQALQARSYAPPPPVLVSGVFQANWFTDEKAALSWLDALRTPNSRPLA